MKRRLFRLLQISFGAGLIAAAVWYISGYPILRPWLAISFAGYAVCLWRWPTLWLVVVPALLPLLDLSPWSGRFFFTEFDALILLTVGTLALRPPNPEPVAPGRLAVNWVLGLLALSYFSSIALRILPLPPITPDSFASYYSPYNSLRVATGFVWALLLYPSLREVIAREPNARAWFCFGVVAGLAGVILVGLYERWMFPGILTLNTDYRIAATFFSMHNGDGHIDIWLATAIPMVAVLLLYRRQWPLMLLLLVGGIYTLVATESRGPVPGLGVAAVSGAIALLAARSRHAPLAVISVAAGSILILTTASAPVFAQISLVQRFETVAPDAMTRLNHWRNALALADNTISARILGMGPGSFPLLHQLRSTNEPHSGWYAFEQDASGRFLRMWPGENLYMGQAVAIHPNTDYTLEMKVRNSGLPATLGISLCEIWLLTSQNCSTEGLRVEPSSNHWSELTRTIHAGLTGTPKSLLGFKISPPTWFTFFVSGTLLSGVDIAEVSLTEAGGHELIQNRSFERGSDHWFWTEDDHLPWHVKNLAVSLLLEQGWLGVIAVGSLLALTLAALMRQILAGEPMSPILAASLTGYLVTAVTVSPFDAPRLALLFYLLCFVILCGLQRPAPSYGRRSRWTVQPDSLDYRSGRVRSSSRTSPLTTFPFITAFVPVRFRTKTV